MKNLKEQVKTAVEIFKKGNFLDAERETKKLIAENPKIPFLYNLLGLIFAEQRNFTLAIEYYEKGLLIDPNYAMIYNNLGLLYYNKKKSENDFKKAEDLFKKSISLDKKISEPHSNLGILYNSINKSEEAIKHYKQAIDINPNFFYAYHNLSNVYVSIGDFDNAKNYLREAIKINPKFIIAHRLLSRITKYKIYNKHLKELENLNVNSEIVNNEDRKYILFALGKAYEDIKDYNKSFRFYFEGNKMFKEKIAFSIKNEKDKFDDIKTTYNKKIFDKFKNAGFKDKSPIFILGMPRSGTTLVEQILSNHEKIFGADEVEFIPDLIQDNFKEHNLKIFFADNTIFNEKTFKKIGEDYIKKMKSISQNYENTTDKLPNNFLSIGFIKLILPNAKIIHCQRNSKDNIFSIFKNHFHGKKINFAYDLKDLVEYYNLYNDLMLHWKTTIKDFIYDIKYENLINDTEFQIKGLFKFCDLDWTEKCLKFYNNKRPIKTASDTQARRQIYKTSVNLWKKYEKNLEEYFLDLKTN